MNQCKYLKQGFNKLKCNKLKKEITFDDCKNCKYKEYKERKPIKQRTAKQAKIERDRYSILTDDLTTCIECGKRNCNINLHEIFYGTGKRKLSIKYGLVIPLCDDKCHDQVNSRGIHFDVVMRDKWHKIGQQKAMEHYDWSIEDFRDVFGKSYL